MRLIRSSPLSALRLRGQCHVARQQALSCACVRALDKLLCSGDRKWVANLVERQLRWGHIPGHKDIRGLATRVHIIIGTRVQSFTLSFRAIFISPEQRATMRILHSLWPHARSTEKCWLREAGQGMPASLRPACEGCERSSQPTSSSQPTRQERRPSAWHPSAAQSQSCPGL